MSAKRLLALMQGPKKLASLRAPPRHRPRRRRNFGGGEQYLHGAGDRRVQGFFGLDPPRVDGQVHARGSEGAIRAAEKEGVVLTGTIVKAVEVDEEYESEAAYVASREGSRLAGSDVDWSDLKEVSFSSSWVPKQPTDALRTRRTVLDRAAAFRAIE